MADRIRLAMDDMPDAAHRVHVIRCDLSTPVSSVTDAAFGDIDYVLNFASESHVDRSITHPTPFILNNVALICNLLDWARDRRGSLEAFVQISTDEVYGPAPEGYAHEEWSALHLPSNPYSASKAAQESIAFSHWRTYDLPIIFTNTMNIIGETQDREKFVPLVLKRVLQGRPVAIHSSPDGKPGSRFYLHARNQADGVLHVLRHVLRDRANDSTGESLLHSEGGWLPHRFHITGEREVDNLTMAHMIAREAGRELKFTLSDFHESRPGHDLRYALAGEKMEATGWKPPVPLEDSLRRTIEWTVAHPEWLL
jgi:dTDP-glucose 4,6-dehydratase